MQTRPLGKTDLDITPIGIGAWAIGGKWQFGWGEQDDTTSIAAIKRGLHLGINWIDTAAAYGLGHSEQVVGEAIKGGIRPYIFTKCSTVWDDAGRTSSRLKAESVKRECEASLKRLGIETIDLYQIHWPRPAEDIAEGWQALADLKKAGKVRHIGVSNFSVEQLQKIEKITPVETLQPPYSLVHPEADESILPYCKEKNIGVIAYAPMASGLLTGSMSKKRIETMAEDDWRTKSPDFQGERLERNLKLQELLTDIGYPHNVNAGVIAIAWTLQNPAVSGAIVGIRNTAQVEELLPAAELRLSARELESIQQFLHDNP